MKVAVIGSRGFDDYDKLKTVKVFSLIKFDQNLIAQSHKSLLILSNTYLLKFVIKSFLKSYHNGGTAY